MASLGAPFDPNAVPEDEKSFDPIPAGDYLLQAIETDVVATKSGTGQRLTLTLEVMEGQYARRKIFEGLNIANANADAQRIGQRQLADLCLSVGLHSVSDSDELVGRPFRARVGIQQDKTGQYGPRNVVKKWNLEQSSAPKPAAAAATAAAPNAYAAAKAATAPPPAAKPAGARPWASR